MSKSKKRRVTSPITPRLRRTLRRKDPLAGDLSFLLDDRRNWVSLSFETKPKDKSITLRLSEDLLSSIKAQAKKAGINYQKWIRASLEEALKAS